LEASCSILKNVQADCETITVDIEKAQEKLMETYRSLSRMRDENIQNGHTEIDTETLHNLQEAYLISNQLIWLKTLSENLRKATSKYQEVL